MARLLSYIRVLKMYIVAAQIIVKQMFFDAIKDKTLRQY